MILTKEKSLMLGPNYGTGEGVAALKTLVCCISSYAS